MTIQRISTRLVLAAVMGLSTFATVGCETKKHQEPAAAPQQEAPVTSGRYFRPNVAPGMVLGQQAFPTGDPATSAVMLSTVTPAEVRAGEPYSYQLYVTNLSTAELQAVNLTASRLSNLEVTGSRPEGARTSDGYNWNLGNLAPNETRTIELTATAGEVGLSANCYSVSYNNLLCTAVKVTQPALAVTKTAPAEVLICDPIPFVFEVRNTGTGTASNVVLTDNLPSGLLTTDGQQTVTANVGDLAPGQAKRVTVQAKAGRTGSYTNSGTLTAAGNLSAQSNQTTTIVRQPVLAIACQSPERIFLGRDVTFNFTVRNTGDAASRGTTLSVPLPAGATFVSATEGGAAAATGATWSLGDIEPNGSRTVALTVRPAGIDTISTSATAQGTCAAPVSANCTTAVQGIPAILLEMVDTIDPVEVGGETTYVITVTNQGSATGTGIKVVLDLPAEEDFVSQAGATSGTVDGKRIEFAPLPALAPKAKAEWRVVIKANAPKDVRTKATVTSDQFSVPIEEIESTNLYR